MWIQLQYQKKNSMKGRFCNKKLPIRCKYMPQIVVQQTIEASWKNTTFQFNHKYPIKPLLELNTFTDVKQGQLLN